MNRHVFGSTLTVVAFWWIVLSVTAGWIWPSQISGTLGEILEPSVRLLIGLGLGVFVGTIVTLAWVWCDKRAQREMLRGEAVRGLSCTLGELPILAKAPARDEHLPSFASVPDVPANFYPEWMSRWEVSHPTHVALLAAILKILHAHAHLPATDIPGGHGGRTLLQHSLLTGYVIDRLSQAWEYAGVRTKKKRLVLALRDPTYKFQRDDPLIVILGLAHDIGKIETFVFNDEGRVIGIGPEHDLTGARIIARLSESWALPDSDRRAMLLALAHYHHPMALPLSPDRRALDDRTIALMELLIRADFATGSQEARGVPPTEEELERSRNGEADLPELAAAERLWLAFSEVLGEHGRINSKDKRFNLGTLCHGDGFNRPMLLLKEDAVRAALIQRLQLPARGPLGDGRYQITIDLLQMLDTKGILHRTQGDIVVSAENALWNVDFLAREKSNAEPKKSAGWSAVIVVDPRLIPQVANAEPYWWWASLQRPTMGSGRALQKKSSRLRSSRDAALWTEDPMDEPTPSASSQADDFDAPAVSLAGAIQPLAAQALPTSPENAPMGVVVPFLRQPVIGTPSPVVDTDAPTPAPVEVPVWETFAPAGAQVQQVDEAAHRPIAEAATELKVSAEVRAPIHQTVAARADPTPPPMVIKKRHDVAPIDVMRALASAVAAARRWNLSLDVLDEAHYLVKASALMRLAPQLDWPGIAFKVEQLCRAKRLDARFAALREDDYAIAFPKDIESRFAPGSD